MSNTTKTEYPGDDVPMDATPLPVVPESDLGEQEQLPGREPKPDHTHDDGDLEPMCTGGGCVQKVTV
ncbi:hypothetical protein ACRAKI_05380 [Saccharothrix isguenensis]